MILENEQVNFSAKLYCIPPLHIVCCAWGELRAGPEMTIFRGYDQSFEAAKTRISKY